MTREKLLSLSDEDLLVVAKKHGIVAHFDRESLIEELTEELDPINDNYALHASLKRYEFTLNENFLPKRLLNYHFPKYYNQNALYCVLRDNYWLFVDWEIAKSSYQAAIKSSGFNGFFLRITALTGPSGNEKLVDFSDLSIKEVAGHCFIQLIDPSLAHKVALFADLGGVEAMLAQSASIYGSHGVARPHRESMSITNLREIAERPLE